MSDLLKKQDCLREKIEPNLTTIPLFIFRNIEDFFLC